MKVRPFILLGHKQRFKLQARIRPILQQWTERWGLGAVDCVVESVTPGSELPKLSNQEQAWRLINDDLSPLWSVIQLSRNDFGIINTLLNTDRINNHTRITMDLLRQSLMDLLGRLTVNSPPLQIEWQGPLSQCLPDEAFEAGAGSIKLCLVTCRQIVNFWIPWLAIDEELRNDAFSREPHISGELASWRPLLHKKRAKVKVELGKMELKVASLTSLQIGDVVRLEKPLDQPCSIVLEGSAVQVKGFLGKQEGARAIVLQDIVQTEDRLTLTLHKI